MAKSTLIVVHCLTSAAGSILRRSTGSLLPVDCLHTCDNLIITPVHYSKSSNKLSNILGGGIVYVLRLDPLDLTLLLLSIKSYWVPIAGYFWVCVFFF